MIVPLAALSVLISIGTAAPTTYDQRQEGLFNLHAKLENFLIVIAIPKSNEIGIEAFNSLANQALELKSIVARHHVPKEDAAAPEDDEEAHKTAEVFLEPKEPYKVEIISIGKKETVPTTEEVVPEEDARKEEEVLIVDSPTVSIGNRKKVAEGAREPEEQPAAEATRKRARNLWSRLSEPEGGRHGISLKKELSGKENDDPQGETSGADDRNDVGPSGNRPEELKLLGDAIENCGPERQRNRSGICEFANRE